MPTTWAPHTFRLACPALVPGARVATAGGGSHGTLTDLLVESRVQSLRSCSAWPASSRSRRRHRPRHRATTPRERDRRGELPDRLTRVRVGHHRRAATRRSRASRPTSASNRARRSASRSTPTRPTTDSTSTGSATTAATARARSRRSSRPRRCRRSSRPASTTTPPASSTAATGPSRRRGPCRPPPSRASTSRKLVRDRRRRPARATSSSSSATTTAHSDLLFQTSDTTWQAYNSYGGNSLYAGAPARPRLQGQLQPAVHHPREHARGLGVQRRVPDDPLARGATATTSATSRASTPTAAARAPRAQRVPLGRPRRVLVRRRSARTSRRRAPPASTSRSSAATRSSGRRAGSPASTARDTPYRTLVCYKETHANAQASTRAGDVDRHVARPALQPAGRRRPARERADRHDLHGQLLRRCTIAGAGELDGKLRFWRNTSVASSRRRQIGDARRRHARLRVGRGPRQRLPAGRPDPLSSTTQRVRSACWTTARPTAPARRRTPDALPRRERRAGLRRRHGAVVVGPRRHARPRRLDADVARCSRRPSTCSPTWACSRRRCRPASSPATASTDTTAPTVDDHLARSAAPRSQRARRHDHRHGGRRGRRRSAASRSRPTAARPGTAPTGRASWTLHVDAGDGRHA